MRKLLGSLFILLSLSSCGFQLRGDASLAPPLHNLYLQTNDPYGQLAHNLKQYLKSSGVHITDSPQQADTTLDIISEDIGQQLLSVGGTQQTRQYNLTLSVTFQVLDKRGIVLAPPQTVSQARTIPILSNQTLGGSNEANNLYRRMRIAIVSDIMARLSSQDMTRAVTHETTSTTATATSR